ncbi:MAG: class I SAM-dependent methyltransferase [Anaerolineaceae bacterium]|nr:class I SAM-dependent methyltransferase [Anaerolineaceae bacterium]
MTEKKYMIGMRPWHYYYVLRNSIDFAIRSKIAWNRPIKQSKMISISSILSHFDAQFQLHAKRLVNKYRLDSVALPFSVPLVQVNLYYLDLLIKTFSDLELSLTEPLTVADVGPSDWFYLPALYSFLKYYQHKEGRTIHIDGYEIDPYRVYIDFHARQNYAKQRSAAFERVDYFPEAFSTHPGKYDLIMHFFPFLFLKDHLSWGLPKSLFNPQQLLEKLAESLKPKGALLVINQGKDEHELQKELIKQNGLKITRDFLYQSDYKKYQIEHYVMVITK